MRPFYIMIVSNSSGGAMNDNNEVRLTLHISIEAWDFIELERHHGITADSIEALLIERAALLHDLLALNTTGQQLGIDPAPLSVAYPYPVNSELLIKGCRCSIDQILRIKAHLRGFPNQSDAIEHLVAHVMYLREAVQEQRFQCARGILNQRIAQAS